MKRYTSRFLKSAALFYMAFPIAYVVTMAMIFDIPIASCVSLLLSPVYYGVCLFSVVTGYGLWEMRRWSWYVFIFANIIIIYQTAVVMTQYSESHHKVFGFILCMLVVVYVIMRVSREVRVPYFFPKIRWWESNPRYRLAAQSEILRKVIEQSVQGEILDLSASGCFIKTRADLKTDEPVLLKFQLFNFTLNCEGVVVWKSESTVTHPKGVGVKFADLDRLQKRTLRMITKRLKMIAQFYRTSRYLLSPEEFNKKLALIETAEFTKVKESAS